MRTFLRAAVVVAVVFAFLSCQNEGPVEGPVDKAVAPEFASMTTTTWYCSTGTQFLDAQSLSSPGDTIKLLVDDPGPGDLFILILGTSASYPMDDRTIIGCDTNPSIIAVDYFSITSMYVENSTLVNLSLLWGQSYAGSINISGAEGLWDGVHIAPIYQYPSAIYFEGDAGTGEYVLKDCVNLDPTIIGCGPYDVELTIDGCELTDGNAECDPADIDSDCTPILKSWILDGETYSFETLPTITDLTLTGFTFSGRSGCKAGVKFKVDWNGYPDNANIAGVYVDYGDDACTIEKPAWLNGDWYQATISANFADCDLRWRARVVLCEDSDLTRTRTSSCRFENIVCGFCY